MGLNLARIEQRARLTPAGMELPSDLSFEEWEDVGRGLRAIEGAVQWWIGDWLNYGERKYGEKYAQAVEATGYAYDTLRVMAYVAGKVETDRRRSVLSFSHHAEVAGLEPPEQDALLTAAESGEWSKNELRRAVKVYKREEAVASLPPERRTCSVEDLSVLSDRGDRFATIYADPPWQYGNQATRASTDNHYSTMSVDEICNLPISRLATENAHIHLWTTNAFLHDAMTRVLPAWGFEYKSMFIWAKTQIGMGNYWRVSHEICLFGIRGSLPFHDRAQRSWQEWPRTQHSAKPHQMYELIEQVSPGPYLELFARRQRKGWTSWGNEIERDLFFKEAV